MITRRAITSSVKCAHARLPSHRAFSVKVVAFKERDKSITDWRIQQMMSVSRKYYDQLWSKGEFTISNDILDDRVVYKDTAKKPMQVVVGPVAMQQLIADARKTYPDLWFDTEQIGFCDSNHLFIEWTAEATNLGNHHGHKPSHHHSKWSGVDLVGFSDDRSKITEITVYRQLSSEERCELEGVGRTHDVVSFEDRYEMRLARLHWEPNELRMQSE